MVFHLVQNQKGKCLHDHIPFNVKGNGIQVFSVFQPKQLVETKTSRAMGVALISANGGRAVTSAVTNHAGDGTSVTGDASSCIVS